MFDQTIPPLEEQWLRRVSENARRLHDDAILLHQHRSYPSAIVFSTFALEEIGKLISFEPFPKAATLQPKQHQRKQVYLSRSSLWLCWSFAVARILDRPVPAIMKALDSNELDLDMLMLYPDPKKLDVQTLDPGQRERFEALWDELEKDELCQFSIRFGADVAPNLAAIRKAALYVDLKDDQVSNPLALGKELSDQLIADTNQMIVLIDRLAMVIAQFHHAKQAK